MAAAEGPIKAADASGVPAALAAVRCENRLGVLCSTVRCDGIGGPNGQNVGRLMHTVEAGKIVGSSEANLTFAELGDIGCTALGRILELGLWTAEEGAAHLHISLDNNSFGDEGAFALCRALTSDLAPPGLSFSTSSCSIGDRGAAALIETGALSHVMLGTNEIGDVGALAIAAWIEAGNGPTAEREGSIRLDGNRRITDVGVAALTAAVKSGRAPATLRSIDACGTGASDEAQDALYDALEAHIKAHPVAPVRFGGFDGAKKATS